MTFCDALVTLAPGVRRQQLAHRDDLSRHGTAGCRFARCFVVASSLLRRHRFCELIAVDVEKFRNLMIAQASGPRGASGASGASGALKHQIESSHDSHDSHGQVATEVMMEVVESRGKSWKVVESRGKWWKVVESGGKWWKVVKSSDIETLKQYAAVCKNYAQMEVMDPSHCDSTASYSIIQHHTASYSIIQHHTASKITKARDFRYVGDLLLHRQ